MADMKVSGGLPAPIARQQSGARAEAVRSAQKAFFQAAVDQSQTQTLASTQAARPQTAPAPKAEAAPTREKSDAVGPQRYQRPGSRVDIRV